MFMMVTGGSGSGKSAFAEQQILKLGKYKRYYIATMQCADEESMQRITRHRSMRAGKQFETIECPAGLEKVRLKKDSAVLLECMSNLTANEFFDGSVHTPKETADKILSGIELLRTQCRHLIVVTNEVFSDGMQYDEMTDDYLKCLGAVNCAMAQAADCVAEVVYGIPVIHRQSEGWQL